MGHDFPTVILRRCLALCLCVSRVQAESPKPEELAALRSKIDSALTDELTRRWYPAALDKTHGGFHQNFARDWTPLPD